MKAIYFFAVCSLFLPITWNCSLLARELSVATPSELKTALADAQPGDAVVLKSGTWRDVCLELKTPGRADAPIVIRAGEPGRTLITGHSSLTFAAPYWVADGLLFTQGSLQGGGDGNGSAATTVVLFKSDFCRLTNTAIIDYNPKEFKTGYYWVFFAGNQNRMDHCYFKGKSNLTPLVGNALEGSRHNTVERCYFLDFPYVDQNGRETLRIWGHGRNEDMDEDGAFFTIQNNLFEHSDGEGEEIISLKSNHNIVRGNTMVRTRGGINLRSGNFNTVADNLLLCDGLDHSYGIRIAGKHHVITGNIVRGGEYGIAQMVGEFIERDLTGSYKPVAREGTSLGRVPRYSQCENTVVVGNTLIDNKGVDLDIGIKYKGDWPEQQRVLLPQNCKFADNVIIKRQGGIAIQAAVAAADPSLGFLKFNPNEFSGNKVFGGQVSLSPLPGGIMVFPSADPVVALPKINPLTADDVGPDWVISLRKAEGNVSSSWQTFKDSRDRSPVGILTDYSYAGYEHGETGIPDVTGPIFKVTDYGARPDVQSSAEEGIRKAVAAAEQAGGGVVLFPPGQFFVWTDRAKVQPIRIHTPGIVIRGAGSAKGGTLIRMVHSGYGTGPYNVPKKPEDFDAIPYLFIFECPEVTGKSKNAAKSSKVTGAVKRSDFEVPVESTQGWQSGDWVSLKAATPKLNNELLAGLVPDPTWTRVIKNGVRISETHQIREVKDNTLIFREPVLVNLDVDIGATVASSPKIEQVGVEDIAFEGSWRAAFVHHRSALDDEGWDWILFKDVANGWVRRCAFLNMNSGVYLENSSACSLLENRFAGAVAHYNVASRRETSFNLIGLLEDQSGHWHGVSTGNWSSGTVVWRCKLMPDQSIDSHGNGPYATLVDRVDGGTMTVCGGPVPAFPNHQRWMVYWNFLYQGSDKLPIDFWNMQKNGVGKFVKPLFVGIHGKEISFKDGTLQGNESPGKPVTPESLYEAQLELRLGKLPGWVGVTRSEWEKVRTQELPYCGTPKTPYTELYKESFPLQELLGDLQALMTKEELGWGVRVELEGNNSPVTLNGDYVLLRTVLHQICTYASATPKIGEINGAQVLKIRVSSTEREVAIEIPIGSSSEAQLENKQALEIAKQLAPACQARLNVQPDKMELIIQR